MSVGALSEATWAGLSSSSRFVAEPLIVTEPTSWTPTMFIICAITRWRTTS